MNANNSYQERNSVPNKAEELFIDYMTKLGREMKRLGFDEKNNNIDGFWKVHPLVRSLPDYFWLDKRKTPYIPRYYHVKGSNKIKVDDLINYSLFEELFANRGVVIYVFMHDESGPIFKSMKEIRHAMTGRKVCEWHDGNQYIPLDL